MEIKEHFKAFEDDVDGKEGNRNIYGKPLEAWQPQRELRLPGLSIYSLGKQKHQKLPVLTWSKIQSAYCDLQVPSDLAPGCCLDDSLLISSLMPLFQPPCPPPYLLNVPNMFPPQSFGT
ncbi:uncharacterized protein LOC121498771 isoform X2 [Vulpes lagopus]|uniref:uncharacterized protein LOC121498771 isoform X2 n=1 Tax=Vulpes lagopus TaxID=494514 RepID=UPI001BC92E07|nr:uncharacterized protein LOC121498771 isoform X2 [Vulpes lagopus]